MLELPLPNPEDTLYHATVDLDGVSVRMTLRWMDRTASWYLDLEDPTGEAIVRGVRVVTHWPLWVRLRDDRRPPGQLLALSLTDDDSPAGRDDLGSRVVLVYYTAAEIEALASAEAEDAPIITPVGGGSIPA